MKPLDSTEKACVETALSKLLNGSTFYISDLNKIGEMLGVDPQRSPRHKFLNGLHCIKYAEMKPELRRKIPELVLECLRPELIDPAQFLFAVLAEGRQLPTIEDQYIDQLPSPKQAH